MEKFCLKKNQLKLLCTGKPVKKKPDEIEDSISIEHWDQMYDATPTNRKSLKIRWMQVWFERLDE